MITALLVAAGIQIEGLTLSVNLTAAGHPISPDIYGMNDNTGNLDQRLAAELKVPVSRWGGDATTRYNWLNDGTNSGFDWYFMAGSGQAHPVPGASADAFISRALAVGAKPLLTIPIIDYINKATTWDCSFPVSIFGAQQSVNPYEKPIIDGVQTQAGNGMTTAGAQLKLTTAQILRTHVPNSPSMAASWIKHLVSKFGAARKGGVAIYQLDNEPTGWSNTHRDIHPNTPTYQEIVQKGLEYARVIKQSDPTAAVLGPCDFGWPAYVGKPEQNGGLWNATYYLQQFRAASVAAHMRLLDYFDEHYYPIQDDGVGAISLGRAGNAQTQANRLRSTRSLWDPGYKENDWIGKYYGPINLIPRMRQWVKSYYPGTKLAITEYNFGGVESINGAITQADVLGIFGREGLDLATMWGPPKRKQPAAFAFRMYCNYDGRRSKFGDVSVPATSSDQAQLAIYAATRSSDKALTIMVINKTAAAITSTVTIRGLKRTDSAHPYLYSAWDLSQIVPQAAIPVTGSAVKTTFPGSSITLLVI